MELTENTILDTEWAADHLKLLNEIFHFKMGSKLISSGQTAVMFDSLLDQTQQLWTAWSQWGQLWFEHVKRALEKSRLDRMNDRFKFCFRSPSPPFWHVPQLETVSG